MSVPPPGNGHGPASGSNRNGGGTGKIGSANRCSRTAASLAASPCTVVRRQHVRRHDVDQVRQPGDVIEVGVREKDIQPVGLQMLAEPAHAGAGIEHDADFRQHQAGRVTPAGGKIAAGSEQDELHGRQTPRRHYNRPRE